MGVAALILGIFGLIFSFFTWVPFIWWIGFVLTGGAIVLGAVGMAKASKAGSSKGVAVAGLVLGIVGAVIGGIIYAACYEVTSAVEDIANSYSYYY